jgi:PAS domain S-box-containing protein
MRLLQTNAAAERLLGEGFGRQSLDHLPRDFEMVDAVAAKPVEAGKWPLAQAVRGHQCQLDFHLRNRASGETHLIESTSVPLCDENGAVRAAIGLIRDVTPVAKGQQAAALLEAITARSDDAFIAIGRDGKVVSWNASATRMFGYAPEEIIGHACRRIVSDEAITLTRDVSQRMLAGGGPERFTIEAVRKDGSRLPVLVEAYPLNDTLGEDAAFMLICRNVTDQKLLRAEASNARAIVLDEARKRFEFLINMSHEFRTSLNRIMGVLPLLVESSLSGQQRDYVRSISTSTEGLLEAVNDILDLAGLAAGKVVFDQSELDLYETVEAAIDIAAEQGQSKDIELVLTMGPDLPRHLMGDRTRVASGPNWLRAGFL